MVEFLVCGKVKPPRREKDSAGIDLFVPDLTDEFIQDLLNKNPGQPVRWSIVGAKAENEEDENKGVFIQLAPHCDILIPSMIRSKFPTNMCLRASNKSGVAVKRKMVIGAEIIDSSYQGIIHIHLINTSSMNQFIGFGTKLCQLLPIMIDDQPFETHYSNKFEEYKDYKNFIDETTFYPEVSERGESGFGSSGNT